MYDDRQHFADAVEATIYLRERFGSDPARHRRRLPERRTSPSSRLGRLLRPLRRQGDPLPGGLERRDWARPNRSSWARAEPQDRLLAGIRYFRPWKAPRGRRSVALTSRTQDPLSAALRSTAPLGGARQGVPVDDDAWDWTVPVGGRSS